MECMQNFMDFPKVRVAIAPIHSVNPCMILFKFTGSAREATISQYLASKVFGG